MKFKTAGTLNEKLLAEPGDGNDETVLPHWKLNRAAPFRLPGEMQDLRKTKLKQRLEHCTTSTLRQILKDSRRKATGSKPELVRRIVEEVGPHRITPLCQPVQVKSAKVRATALINGYFKE